MKTLKQILKESDTLEIRENINGTELVEMVKLGLLEENKLPLLERALSMNIDLMTEAEKNIIVDLLQKLISEKLGEKKDINILNPGNLNQSNYMSDSKVPVIITFKRRSIRVFPNGIKIALYYSPQLDKYISIPFGEKSAETLGTNINEGKSVKNTNTTSLSDSEKEEIRDVSKEYGARVGLQHKTNIQSDNRKRIRNRALERARGARQLARIRGGYGEGLRRAEDKYGTGISGSVAKGVHTAKYLGAKVINKFMKEDVETSFFDNLQEARSKTIKYKPKTKRRISSFKTKNLGKTKRPITKVSKTLKTHKKVKKSVEKKVETPAVPTDVDKHTKIYAKAKQNYNNATSRPITVWDAKKRKKVTLDAKEHYRNIMNHHAEKIRSGGGRLPEVKEREKPKRTPGIKPPPALAEQEQLNEFIGKILKGAASWAAKKAMKALSSGKDGDSDNSKKFNDDEEKDKEDRFTRKRKGDTVGLGKTVGTNRVAPDAAEWHSVKRQSGSKATQIDMRESNFELIRSLAESNQGGKIEIPFDGDTVSINNRIAKKVLSIHETLNKTNKKNMENMLNESISSFRKVINFAIRA